MWTWSHIMLQHSKLTVGKVLDLAQIIQYKLNKYDDNKRLFWCKTHPCSSEVGFSRIINTFEIWTITELNDKYLTHIVQIHCSPISHWEYFAVCGKTNLGLAAGPYLTDPAGGWREPDLQQQTAGGTTENKAFSFCVHTGSHPSSSTSSTAWRGTARC